MSNLFEKIEVWRRMEDHIRKYICFRDIETNLFYVQEMDFIYRNTSDEIKKFQKNLEYELFLDDNPRSVTNGANTLLEAIERHDKKQ